MLSPVIHERLIQRFNYWNQSIKQGMVYRNNLYDCCRVFPVARRLEAYAFIDTLSERNLDICLTVSEQNYTVWMNLRSLSGGQPPDEPAHSEEKPQVTDCVCCAS